MANQKTKSALKLLLKLALSGLAIYLVFTKIDLSQVWLVVRKSNVAWLITALVVFNLSKFIAAHRFHLLIRQLGVQITSRFNLALYYVGMFYNLFLPGGIGGDGYKVYYLQKRFEAKTRQLVSAVLLDRLSGAAMLAFLALAMAAFKPDIFANWFSGSYALSIVLLALSIPVLVGVISAFFKIFKPLVLPLIGLSVSVQLVQLVCVFCILSAYGVDTHFALYFILFLVSSIAAMLPLSFGGVGLRELVFLYAATIFPIDQPAAVALALMFFVITAISSLCGAFIKLPSGSE